MTNSIVAGQISGADCTTINGGTITSGGYNIESATSCGFTSGGDQQNVGSSRLNLQPLANNGVKPHPDTHALGALSVAIDKIPIGTNGCASTNTDERGGWRANGAGQGGGACDVGAYEYDSTIDAVTAITLRDLTAMANTSPGVIGAAFAALAALGAACKGKTVGLRERPRIDLDSHDCRATGTHRSGPKESRRGPFWLR